MTRNRIKPGAWVWVFFLSTRLLYGDIYVKTNGDDTASGVDWANAYATISNAVAHAIGSETNVQVSNGVYSVSVEILITNGITVTGIAGQTGTVVQSQTGATTNYRIFRITNANAVLDGFAICKGGVPANDKKGAGIYLAAGTVRNCTISNNAPTNTDVYGAGIYMSGGTLSNCLICNNSGAGAANGQVYGHGVYVTNAMIMNCVIRNNNTQTKRGNGALYMMANSMVSNCLIQSNVNGGSTFCNAAGAVIVGGTLKNSSIVGNANAGTTGSRGGGVYISGGRMENCLIASNSMTGAATYGGGGVSIFGGTIVNCTITANKVLYYIQSTVYSDGAGVQWGDYLTAGGGTITNSIVYYNTQIGSQAQINIGGTAGYSNAFFNCCSPDLAAGSNGNITADPQFVSRSNGNFRLLPYSPCVDAGTNIEAGVDRDGNVRPQDGRGTGTAIYDIGAYELVAATSYFNCYFQAQTNEAFNALDAHFTASVFGPNTNGLYYWWNFGNGTQEGAGLGSVTRSYTQGTYSVSLIVSNEMAAVTNWAITNYIRVAGTNAYVATNGAHVAPFDTWDKAATSILAAVQTAVVTTGGATRVVVSNGTYNIPSSAASIFIDRGITVASVSGASNTIVWGTSGSDVYPDFDLDHPDAVVDGFTMGNANVGVMIHRGTVRNCIMRNNAGNITRLGSGVGAGACMLGGVVENCSILSNSVAGGTGIQGGGLWMTGESLARNCVIAGNGVAIVNSAAGGGVYINDPFHRSVLRSCLVCSNEVGSGQFGPGAGGGVALYGGRVENCTIISNNIKHTTFDVTSGGGGLYCSTGTVVNTIVYYNTRYTTSVDNLTGSVALVSYSCAPELADGVAGNITHEPGFVDFNQRNYRLALGSPCLKAGMNQDWMIGATDLEGKPRMYGGRVDLGAYSTYVPPSGTIFSAW